MATSGSFTTSKTDQGKMDCAILKWSRTSYNATNQTSTISWRLVGSGSSGYAWVYTYSVTIGNKTFTGSPGKMISVGEIIASGTVTVTHTNGAYTLSANAKVAIYYSGKNVTGSGRWALDNIGTKPSNPTIDSIPSNTIISETAKSIALTWKASSATGGGTIIYYLQVSINGGAYSQCYSGTSRSYTYTITPAQGKTYKFRVYAKNSIGSSGYGYSGICTTNSLSPPTIGAIGTYNPYTSPTLNISLSGGSQSNSGSFKRMCALYYGSECLMEASYDSISWNNTSVNLAYSAINYATKLGVTKYSDTFKIVAWTENDNRTRSSYVEKTFTVNLNTDGGATPTLNAPTFSGGAFNNPATCFIASISNLIVTSGSGATRRAPNGTTLSYKIECTGVSAKTGNTATFSGLSAGTKTVKVTVTDSRGLSTSVSKTCIFQPYAPPTIKSIVGARLSDPNTSAKVTYTVSHSPIYANGSSGTDLNGISAQHYNKNTGPWVDYTSGTIITGLNTELSYVIGIRVADKVRTTTYTTASVLIPTIKSLLSIRKTGVGIGGIPKSGFGLDVAEKARFQNGVYYVVGGRDREPLKMIEGGSAGDGIQIGAGGLLIIGSGESHQILYENLGLVGQNEETYIASDNDVRIETNLNANYASKKEFIFSKTGQLTTPGSIVAGVDVTANGGSLYSKNNGRQIKIGSNNAGYCHYQTTAPKHWFDKDVCVRGDVFAGTSYNRRLAYVDEIAGIKVNNATNATYATTAGTATRANETYMVKNNASEYAYITSAHGIRFTSKNRMIYFEGQASTGAPHIAFRPQGADTGEIYLGVSAARWNTIYTNKAVNTSSDRTKKKDISVLDERYEKLFMDLIPVRYMLTSEGSDRYHTGFIAQDIHESMQRHGISDLELGAFCKDLKVDYTVDDNGNEIFMGAKLRDGEDPYEYSLRYEEFISIIVHMLKKLYSRVDKLENIILKKG